MCGIVGYIGPKDSIEMVLMGLKRLEYRGYDSSGIAFVDHENKLRCFKAVGKIQALIRTLGEHDYKAQAIIGHTRWATHGIVNDLNAHPHTRKNISLVHNGIIENCEEIKNELKTKKQQFFSDTDTETFLISVLFYMEKESCSFHKAVVKAFSKIQGNSAFVILNRETKEIIAVKRGVPLVCGINKVNSQVFVSSDPYALVGLAGKLYFPEDDVVCCLSGGNQNLLNFFELDGQPSKRYTGQNQTHCLRTEEKGKFEHFMLKEIYEQPGLIRALHDYYIFGEGRVKIDAISQARPLTIHIVACGTAYYASLVLARYLEQFNRIRAIVAWGSEFRYQQPLLKKCDWGIFVSQSGETADTLAAQNYCKEQGIPTLALVNVEESTLYRKCDYNLSLRAGMEIGVASTKAFTQMALVGRLFSFVLECKEGGIENGLLNRKLYLLADRIDELLKNVGRIIKIAECIHNYKGYFYTGRGLYFPIALEGALKLKEIAYVHAEGYASGELKHGPIALIDQDMVNIAIVAPELYEKTVSNIKEIKARKGVVVIIGPENDGNLGELGDFFIPINFDGLEELAPLYVNVVNQLLAYHMAKFKGTDIDHPRNLAKSVTVE